MVYIPDDIWRLIYEFDDTYRIKYKSCIQEMNALFWKNRTVNMMGSLFNYYELYKRLYCFRDDGYGNMFYYNYSLPTYVLAFYRYSTIDHEFFQTILTTFDYFRRIEGKQRENTPIVRKCGVFKNIRLYTRKFICE